MILKYIPNHWLIVSEIDYLDILARFKRRKEKHILADFEVSLIRTGFILQAI